MIDTLKYERLYDELMHIFYVSRLGLGASPLYDTIVKGDDDILKAICYIELRRHGLSFNEIRANLMRRNDDTKTINTDETGTDAIDRRKE